MTKTILDVTTTMKEFPFVTQCQTLPRMDVFVTEEKASTIYVGRVDIPQHWMKEFARRMTQIRQAYPEVTLHYTLEVPEHARWNLSLKETYQK